MAYLLHFWMKSCIAKLAHIPRIAKKILALKPRLIALEGPLGAGKTTLTKAIASELGVTEPILSPTFVLHSIYELRIKNYGSKLDHIDAWRVEDFLEIENLGLLEMIKNKHLVIIEWADKFSKQISALSAQRSVVWVKLEYSDNEDERRITVTHP